MEVRGSLTTQLELGEDLLAGDVAHEEGEAPGIAEAGGQPVEQRPGGLVDAGAQSLLRLGGGEGDHGEAQTGETPLEKLGSGRRPARPEREAEGWLAPEWPPRATARSGSSS